MLGCSASSASELTACEPTDVEPPSATTKRRIPLFLVPPGPHSAVFKGRREWPHSERGRRGRGRRPPAVPLVLEPPSEPLRSAGLAHTGLSPNPSRQRRFLGTRRCSTVPRRLVASTESSKIYQRTSTDAMDADRAFFARQKTRKARPSSAPRCCCTIITPVRRAAAYCYWGARLVCCHPATPPAAPRAQQRQRRPPLPTPARRRDGNRQAAASRRWRWPPWVCPAGSERPVLLGRRNAGSRGWPLQEGWRQEPTSSSGAERGGGARVSAAGGRGF